MPRFRFLIFAVILAGLPSPALAGPPFITDDAEPTDYHKWEIYNFVGGAREDGSTVTNFGVDLNYGGLRDVQLTATLPLQVGAGQPIDDGDVELAAKLKLIHQQGHSLMPDIAIFPRVFLPTGRGSRHTQLLLPVWAQKDYGKWSLFGGGGYMLNPGPGQRNYPIWGAVVNRQVAGGFQLGLEYYGQGPASISDRPLHGVNLGTVVHIHGPFSWAASFGQGLNRRQTVFYSSLKLDL